MTTRAAGSPPGQHDVADRQLAVDQVVGHPLVDPLVAAAQEREASADGELAGDRLVEAPPARAEQEQRTGDPAVGLGRARPPRRAART